MSKNVCWPFSTNYYAFVVFCISLMVTSLVVFHHRFSTNLKAKAKKALGNDKVELAKTGGGTFVRQLSELDMKVIALFGHRATPLKNPFDADASYNKETGYLTICTCEN